jgi:hypothetical protein
MRGAAVSKAFGAASKDFSADGNAAVWEHAFQSRDAVLHRSLKAAPHFAASQSWRGRLRTLADLESGNPWADVTIAAAGWKLKNADVVLHRHPAHGFLLHLSEFRGTIVAYALRAPPSAAVDPGASSSSSWGAATSATKAKLDAFHCLPEMPDGHRPRAPAATLLVLRGVNDRPIHAFHSLAGVLAFVQAAGAGSELCRWHFVECPTRGVKAIPAECKLTPDLTPAGMFANDVADYIQ